MPECSRAYARRRTVEYELAFHYGQQSIMRAYNVKTVLHGPRIDERIKELQAEYDAQDFCTCDKCCGLDEGGPSDD